MELITYLIDLFPHLDKHLTEITLNYGTWTYLILFLVIFAETGLVVTPFLPGDSLLFAAGAICALGTLNIYLLIGLLIIGVILGDNTNYWIGRIVGPKVFTQKHSRFFKIEHLEKTQKFYEKHGGKTVVIARYIPIVRTFTPFVSGIGSMNYPRFLTYSIAGGITWICIFSFAGYFFGNLEIVKRNFSVIIIAIIILSVLPMFIEYLKHRKEKKNSAKL